MLTLHAFLSLILVKTLIAAPPVIVDQHGRSLPPTRIPGVPENCDYRCTRVDLPVCASNGQCMQRFHSECAMSGYNCRNPQKPFVIIDDWKCEPTWAPLCKSNELGPE